ncbi:hypothetical protein [Microcoleus phage My-WqHQDG]|nr:hypothetical protein [Microcoleus phage My-WqHQDG]
MTDISIQGYGLLLNGVPLCVYRSSSDECVSEHYTLSRDEGMPYIVDLHTMRYYLAKSDKHSGHSDLHPQHAPKDYSNLLDKAAPCHIQVSMTRGRVFTLEVTTSPLDKPIEPYKVLPKGCLDDTKSGPIKGSIIKVMKYTPPDLGGEYVSRHGHDVDTFIQYGTDTPNRHLFNRRREYPVFYSTFDMGAILSSNYSPEG